MASAFWMRQLINKTFSQRFFWSKLSHYPIIGRLIEYLLFEDDTILYLPKDRVIAVDKQVKADPNTVLPSQVVDHFIRQADFHWVMDFCICRDSAKCEDYPIDLGCLFLGEAAMGINPKFGRQVTQDEALEHVRRCREAGLVHLIGRNKLDTVWLNVGPARKLLTICNCCPCCCLWRVLPVISPKISSKVSRMPGVSVNVTAACVGCGTCVDNVCFVNAIRLTDVSPERQLKQQNDKRSIKKALIDPEACRGCGRCVDVCPKHAIEINIENEAYVKDSIERIESVVDVGR